MNRRNFNLSAVVGTVAAFFGLSIKASDNPKGLPVVMFNGERISNGEQILARIPFDKNGCRRASVWVNFEDKVNFSVRDAFHYGEMELEETGGSGYGQLVYGHLIVGDSTLSYQPKRPWTYYYRRTVREA